MIFGIDFGMKRIGLAKIVQDIIIPIPAILRKNRKQASKEFKEVLLANSNYNDFSQILLVFGLPMYNENNARLSSMLHKQPTQAACFSHENYYKNSVLDSCIHNGESEMQKRIKHFLSLIEFNGQLLFIDESFSSREAEEKLCDRNYEIRQKSRKNGVLDSISACIILERFLEQYKGFKKDN